MYAFGRLETVDVKLRRFPVKAFLYFSIQDELLVESQAEGGCDER